ncbi:hypothetical protein G6L37_00065 [Agrobacterium rubi]|nr:hypothetical protein [Agrobacterium rubi]NTF23644.1 hypothetical protein [Agrobacterium rubi]
MRFLTSEIPGTRFRAIVRETTLGTVASIVPKRISSDNMELDSVDGLVKFLCAWDAKLMQSGLGASYFPVAALEFVDALLHDEGRRDLLSIRSGTEAASGFALVPEGEWKPTPFLEELIRAYSDDESAGACARQSAWDLSDFIHHGEEKPFDPKSWGRLTAVRALRKYSASGREVASPIGIWREVLAEGAVRCASNYLAGFAGKPRITSGAMANHLGSFIRQHKIGGCDLYILWNWSDFPIAIGAVSADGDIVMVDITGPNHVDCHDAVEPLLDAVGNGHAGRPKRTPRYSQR